MSNIWSKLTNLTSQVTGLLGVKNGGTGAATLTSNGVLIGHGTSAVTALADATTTHILHGGSPPTFGSIVAADLPLVTQSTAGAVSSAGQLLGTNTNDNASAGNVGEFISAVVTSDQTQNSPANNTYYDVTSATITLTAGDWDVYFHAAIDIGISISGQAVGFVSLNQAGTPVQVVTGAYTIATVISPNESLSGYARISINSTLVYKLSVKLVIQSGSPTLGSITVLGSQAATYISARRAR